MRYLFSGYKNREKYEIYVHKTGFSIDCRFHGWKQYLKELKKYENKSGIFSRDQKAFKPEIMKLQNFHF